MASPVVAGLAAFILSYYPNLTPQQVKQAIEQSVTKIATPVKNPENGESVSLSDLSASGGVINAYEAIKLAAALSGNAPQPVKSKSVVRKVKKA
jgi:subtilisin family serine protease